MPYTRKFIPGDRLVDCDVCGQTWRRSQMRKGVTKGLRRQKNLSVCPDDYDPVHPNDERIPFKREGALEEIV